MAVAAFTDVFRRSQRGGVLLVVAAAHAAAFLAFGQLGAARQTLPEGAPLQVVVMPEQQQEIELPPPPTPQFVSLERPTLVMPEIQLPTEPPPAPKAITLPVESSPPAVVAHTEAPPRLVSEVAYVKPPQPRYPPESRRSGEEGLVVLRVLIDQQGRATHIEIEQSSGHSRLDQAAREAVQRALFRPYVENGIARSALAMIPIEFTWKSSRSHRS
jgi:protein TonB